MNRFLGNVFWKKSWLVDFFQRRRVGALFSVSFRYAATCHRLQPVIYIPSLLRHFNYIKFSATLERLGARRKPGGQIFRLFLPCNFSYVHNYIVQLSRSRPHAFLSFVVASRIPHISCNKLIDPSLTRLNRATWFRMGRLLRVELFSEIGLIDVDLYLVR